MHFCFLHRRREFLRNVVSNCCYLPFCLQPKGTGALGTRWSFSVLLFLFLSFQSARGFREDQALWLKQVLRDGSLDPPANGTKAGSCSEFFNFNLKLLLARRPLLLRSRRFLRCVPLKICACPCISVRRRAVLIMAMQPAAASLVVAAARSLFCIT